MYLILDVTCTLFKTIMWHVQKAIIQYLYLKRRRRNSEKSNLLLYIIIFLFFVALIGSNRFSYYREDNPSIIRENARILSKLLAVDSLRYKPPFSKDIVKTSRTAAKIFTDQSHESFIARYDHKRKYCAFRPFVPSIHDVIDSMDKSTVGNIPYVGLLNHTASLLIFVEKGFEIDELYFSLIRLFSVRHFPYIFVLENPNGERSNRLLMAAVGNAVQKSGRPSSVRVIVSRTVSRDLKIVKSAKSVIVHGSEEAALYSLASEGTVFVTNTLAPYARNPYFRSLVSDLQTTNDLVSTKETIYRHIFKQMGRVKPSCCNFESLGGSVQKVFCTNVRNKSIRSSKESLIGKASENLQKEVENCWTLSISNIRLMKHEKDIIEMTGCHLYVIYCSGSSRISPELDGLIVVHKHCLNSKYRNPLSIKNMIKMASTAFHFVDVVAPKIMSLDTDGLEYALLGDFLKEIHRQYFPEQIILKVCLTSYLPNEHSFLIESQIKESNQAIRIRLLFANFFDFRFRLIYRKDDDKEPRCTEVTLLILDSFPPEFGRG